MSNLEISQIAAPEASGAAEADRQEEVDRKQHMKNMFFYSGYIRQLAVSFFKWKNGQHLRM